MDKKASAQEKKEKEDEENRMQTFYDALIRDNPQCKEAIVEKFASGKAFSNNNTSSGNE